MATIAPTSASTAARDRIKSWWPVSRRVRGSLTELYERYADRVYSLAFFILRDEPCAREVTQKTFLRLWQRSEPYRFERGHFAAWLLTIARHAALAALRKERRLRTPLVSLDQCDGRGVVDDSQSVELQDGVMRELLNALPAEWRQLIIPAYSQGMSLRRLAAHLHVPLGIVKSRLHNGMQKLCEAWFCPIADPA